MGDVSSELRTQLPEGFLPVCGCVFPILLLCVALVMDLRLGEYLHRRWHTRIDFFYYRNLAVNILFFVGCPLAVGVLVKTWNREYKQAAIAYLVGFTLGALTVLTT